MEYLMTYGWAILVIVIVAAVLFMLGVLKPGGSTAPSLIFSPGSSAYSFRLSNGTAAFELDYGQAYGYNALITHVGCSGSDTPELRQLDNPVLIPSGEHRWILGGDSGNIIDCRNESEGQYEPRATGTGMRYRGTVCIQMSDVETGAVHTTCGDLNTKFEPGYGGEVPTPGGSGTPVPTIPPDAVLISDCSSNAYSIDSPGYYYLDSDLSASNNNDCIVINADDVTVNCQSHSLTGTDPGSGTGIVQNGRSRVVVRNCYIGNFYMGIQFYDAQSSLIESNTLQANGNRGIGIAGGSNDNATGNTVSGYSDWGVILEGGGSNNHRVTGNSVTGTGYGIVFWYGVPDNYAASNTVSGSSSYDFYCPDSAVNSDGGSNTCGTQSGCENWLVSCPAPGPGCTGSCSSGTCDGCGATITSSGTYLLDADLQCGECNGIKITANDVVLNCQGRTITGTGNTDKNGVYVNGATGATVQNCVVTGFGRGIFSDPMGYSSGATITGNTATGNVDTGIRVNSDSNTVTGNTASSNAAFGFDITGSNNLVQDNIANSQSGGIYVGGTGNQFIGNNASSNSQYGFDVGSGTSALFEGNTATSTVGFHCYGTDQNTDNGNTCDAQQGCESWLTSCPPPPEATPTPEGPTYLATGLVTPIGIVADGGYVYWTGPGDSNVYKVPVDGGSVTTIASEERGPFYLDVDGGFVYWANHYNPGASIKKVPVDGGTPVTLASGLNAPLCIDVKDGYVYWTDNGSNDVKKVSVEGGSVTTLASGLDYPTGIKVSDGYVYFAERGTGSIKKVPVGGGSVTTLASGLVTPWGIAVDGSYVYYSASGTIGKVPIDGGSTTVLASGGNYDIAIDGSNVYWVTDGIRRVPLDGGSVTTLVSGLGAGWSIALDENYVYWSGFNDGNIGKIAK